MNRAGELFLVILSVVIIIVVFWVGLSFPGTAPTFSPSVKASLSQAMHSSILGNEIYPGVPGYGDYKGVLLAENDDIRITMKTSKVYGVLLADEIPVLLIIESKIRTSEENIQKGESSIQRIRIAKDRFPMKGGALPPYIIRDRKIIEYEDRTEINLVLQSFQPPTSKLVLNKPLVLFYTAEKYWSKEDGMSIFRPLEFRLMTLYPNQLNFFGPPAFWKPEYKSSYIPHSSIFFVLGIGFCLLAFKRDIVKKLRELKGNPDIKFLKRIETGDLTYYNLETVSKELNRILQTVMHVNRDTKQFLLDVLYKPEGPEIPKIKKIAKELRKYVI